MNNYRCSEHLQQDTPPHPSSAWKLYRVIKSCRWLINDVSRRMASLANRWSLFLGILFCLSLSYFYYKHVSMNIAADRRAPVPPATDLHSSAMEVIRLPPVPRPLYGFPEVPTVTSWGAPIVWEGSYDSEKENRFHQEQRTVVGLSVFAVNKYLESYLHVFLVSANAYFMSNLSCVFYILTDYPDCVPNITFRPGISKVVLQVPKRNRWQDISMLRMKDLLRLVLPRAMEQVDYLFCMDVDQIFTSNYGPEVLGELVGQLHSGFYQAKREDFTYETDPRSAAYIPPEQGQFYYHAAVFGGTPSRLFNLTSSCLKGILRDKEHKVEAVWHDESHLNRYFVLETLPLKILSPEYCWDNRLRLKYHKLIWAQKKYSETRV